MGVLPTSERILGVNMRLTQGAEPITRKQPGEPGPSQWQDPDNHSDR